MTGPDGFAIFDYDARTALWAAAAGGAARTVARDPGLRGPEGLRHGGTWFVGVDALPNAPDGSIGGVPLAGPWNLPDLPLHPAQLSIIYAGYPRQDAGESDANHRYRLTRDAAHVDGLLPVGPDRRRFAREYHAYILSVPLGDVAAAPTVVWRGSQRIMQAALVAAIGGGDPAQVDITDAYTQARREVFATCERVPLPLKRGQSALLHPFVLHGTAPWGDSSVASGEGRMIAFFRPECAGGPQEWLATP